jgi:hypothetical protein
VATVHRGTAIVAYTDRPSDAAAVHRTASDRTAAGRTRERSAVAGDRTPRRRRRWPRRLALVTLLGVVCCCGLPAGYLTWCRPAVPVTAVLPRTVADLRLRDDSASRRAVRG